MAKESSIRPDDSQMEDDIEITGSDQAEPDSEPEPEVNEGRRHRSYEPGDFDSTPELIAFMRCQTVASIQKMKATDLVLAAGQANETVSEWEARLVDLSNQLTGMKKETTELRLQIAAKDGIISFLIQERDTALAARGSSPTIAAGKSTKLPDTDPFTGEEDLANNKPIDPSIEDWLIQIRKKLETNADHYPTDANQIAYVLTRIKGDAKKHIQPRLRADVLNPFRTVEEILTILERAYSDPNRKQKASDEFRVLYQNDKSFHVFWADFQRLAIETDMPEETQLTELRYRINADLQLALASFEADSVYDLARKCITVDANVQRVNKLKNRKSKGATSSSGSGGGSKRLGPPVKIENRGAPGAGPASSGGLASGRDSGKRSGDRPAWTEEQVRRYNENACFGCGQKGHISKECPNKGQGRRANVQEVAEAFEAIQGSQSQQPTQPSLN
jgi:hypothetical protein